MSDVIGYAGPNFHCNFPWSSRILQDDGTAYIANLLTISPPIETRRRSDVYIGVLSQQTYVPYTAETLPKTSTLSGSLDMVYSLNNSVTAIDSSDGINLSLKLYQRNVINLNEAYGKVDRFACMCYFYVNSYIHVTFEATIFYQPLLFTTVESYYFEDTAPTTPIAGSGIPARLSSLASLNQSLFDMSSPTKTTTEYYNNTKLYSSASVSISTVPNADHVKYKLLNRDDWDLCRTTHPSLYDEAFFNALTSPTLEEAFTNGGFEYWGIFKFVGNPCDSVTLTYSLEATASSFVTSNTSIVSEAQIGLYAIHEGSTAIDGSLQEQISDGAGVYDLIRLGPKIDDTKNAPSFNCPSIILRY